jgi:hypothetical protein
MFSTALGFLSKFGKDDDIDEQKVVQEHEKVYQQGQGSQMDAKSIGSYVYISSCAMLLRRRVITRGVGEVAGQC